MKTLILLGHHLIRDDHLRFFFCSVLGFCFDLGFIWVLVNNLVSLFAYVLVCSS